MPNRTQHRTTAAAERKERREKAEHLQELMESMEQTRAANIRTINEKHGYLHKKSNTVVGDWKRRWCTIKDGSLLYYKNPRDPTPAGSIPLMLCTVKDAPKTIEKYHCFELVSMRQNRSFYFQAENEQDRQEWMSIIQNNIALILNGLSNVVSNKETIPTHLQDLWSIEGNNVCADCGAASPDWASINLGILVCIDCSGTHRSLGTHISKVRSLKLDKADPNVVEHIKRIGNNASNKIWAETAPAEACQSLGRETFIREKYTQKSYINRLEQPTKELKDYCVATDHLGVMRAIASGAVVDEYVGTSPSLHEAIRAKSFACFYALILNGADANTADTETGDSPLHLAANSDENYEMVILLIKNGADVNVKNNLQEMPVDTASRMRQPKIEEYLLTEKLLQLQNIQKEFNKRFGMSSGVSSPR